MAHKVICIGRQFGSGGHIIGETLAKQLGVSFYDSNLISLAAERSGLRPEILRKGEEKRTSAWFYTGATDPAGQPLNAAQPEEITYALQRDIILDAARREDCIIVGRCSDVILRATDARLLSVFIAAPFEDRVRRKMEIEHWDEREATVQVRKTDRRRKAYYSFNTGLDWGEPESYDLCLNSTALGIDRIVAILAEAWKNL